jgi:regulator of RNase E activity RraB
LSEKKLSSICHKVKDEDDPDDFFSVLEHHINNGEFEKFEAQFKTFQNILKTNINKNGYADNLLSIYSLSISLYEIGELFSEFDIERQLTFIDKHESNLNKENIEVKKIAKAEFYFFSNQFEKLEKICISYNRTDNNELNLTIYSLHAMSDYRTKPENPRGLSLFLREIDECDCIDKPQYLRHYIVLDY